MPSSFIKCAGMNDVTDSANLIQAIQLHTCILRSSVVVTTEKRCLEPVHMETMRQVTGNCSNTSSKANSEPPDPNYMLWLEGETVSSYLFSHVIKHPPCQPLVWPA